MSTLSPPTVRVTRTAEITGALRGITIVCVNWQLQLTGAPEADNVGDSVIVHAVVPV
jgi:hypothetical protein